MQPGDPVKYRGRHFVLVSLDGRGNAVIRDDEGESMTVRAAALSPA